MMNSIATTGALHRLNASSHHKNNEVNDINDSKDNRDGRDNKTTIFALATAQGKAGVGIVRISGPYTTRVKYHQPITVIIIVS